MQFVQYIFCANVAVLSFHSKFWTFLHCVALFSNANRDCACNSCSASAAMQQLQCISCNASAAPFWPKGTKSIWGFHSFRQVQWRKDFSWPHNCVNVLVNKTPSIQHAFMRRHVQTPCKHLTHHTLYLGREKTFLTNTQKIFPTRFLGKNQYLPEKWMVFCFQTDI